MVKRFRQATAAVDEEEEYVKRTVKRVLEPVADRRRSRTIKVPKKVVEPGKKDEAVTARNKRQRIEEELLRACFAEGMQREEVMRLMDITEFQLAAIEKRLLANDGQRHLSMTAAHRYYIYALQQEQCVHDLDGFIQEAYDSIHNWNEAAKLYGSPGAARKVLGAAPSNQSAILAIKAKSEILDRTIKMGQEMGIIQKRAKEVRVSGQLNLAALPTEQLKKELSKKLDQFQELVGKGTVPDTYKRMLEKANGRLLPGRSDEPESVVDAEFSEESTRPMDGGEG
jgi:hypothetical protein